MKICYKAWRPNAESLEIVQNANTIIDEWQAKGLDLTLRQLYYQFVARGLSENTLRAYKRIGTKVDRARLAGLIDWWAIVDRLRYPQAPTAWEDPAEIINATARSFKRDRWSDQDCRVEVWVEKDALSGVFGTVCRELEVPLLACRGYMSQSAQWRASLRLKAHVDAGQRVHVLHFGDHDPSGLDMTGDITRRFWMFGANVTIERMALNMDQVDEFEPPPNPTKLTDSRANEYIQEHGYSSWELDALDPDYLQDTARRRIEELRDSAAWLRSVNRDDEDREDLTRISDNFSEVVDFVRTL